MRDGERQELTTRWASQSTDPKWSDELKASLVKLLEESNFDGQALRDLDCRKTVCRFSLVGRDGRDAIDLIHVARDVHDETWIDHHEERDGTWTLEIFSSRPGFMLSGNGGAIPGPT